MIDLNITNETDHLKTVIIGQPHSMGSKPAPHECYDAKSYYHTLQNTYPNEEDIVAEMDALQHALQKHGVEVLRPHILENCNQVFARDVAFVIDDVLIVSNIIPDRADETEAYLHILNRIRPKKILLLPDRVHIEGGDVVLYNDIIFLGVYTEDDYPSFKTARTNRYAIDFLRSAFPHKEVVAIELKKHDTDPAKGILHLDCTFMPVAGNRAIIYSQGFANQRHYAMLLEIFGADNIFEITCREMVDMNSNIFSISPKTVISEQRFTRLNRHLTENWQIEVEAIPYYEISKMGGLLRCSTLPLVREKQPAQHQ